MHTLLLADESVTVQRVIALTFAEQEIRVVSVPDGRQAMDRMTAEAPDIVLAGTTLPQVSGYDLAQFMRSTPALKDVPVLLLSGAFENVDEARLAASGANGILEKPVEPTVVIGRVKELLGLKSDEKPGQVPGRTVTPASGPADSAKKPPTPTTPRAVTSTKGTPSKWDQLRNQTGLDANTKSVEDASTGRGDYLDTLDTAFDTLDQHLAGRPPAAKTPRNPAGPLGAATLSGDLRSPNPRGDAPAAPGNPVYEVDDQWFGDKENQDRATAKAGRREISEDLHDPSLMPEKSKPEMAPIYEVDDEWFKDDDKSRAAKAAEQKQLAAEMGIHDVDFGDEGKKKTDAGDFDFGADDLKAIQSQKVAPVEPQKPVIADKPAVVEKPGIVEQRAVAPAPVAPEPPKPTTIAPMPPPKLADDFDALLAFERGERSTPPLPPPAEIKVVTPEITEQMLDQIAARVADRLTASAFGEQLRNAMTQTMRDAVNETVSATVRPVVAETSERVVREVVSETAERVVRDVVPRTVEGVVREVVPQTAENVLRDVVGQTTDRVVREVVSKSVDEVVREAVTQATERAVPEAVSQATERAVREVVPQTAERVVREVVAETSDRAVREVISETSERLVREEIERIKSKRNT